MKSPSSFRTLDDQRFSGFHWRAVLTTGLGVFTDFYDNTTIGMVLPMVLLSFGIKHASSLQGAALAGSALVGMGIGAIIFGLLGQRGRKTFYGLDMLIMAIAAIAQMFVSSIWWLVAVRFVLGLGIGGDYVLSPTIMSEHANQKDRGKLLALGFATMSNLGPIAAALLALLLLQALHVSPDWTWRIVLGSGAIPALSVLYLRRTMPETARYLARLAGDQESAVEVAKSISGDKNVSLPGHDRRPFGEVFRQHAPHFLAAGLLWMLFDLVAYSTSLFGPSLIASRLGLGPVTFVLVLSCFFSLPGALVASLLVDKIGRRALQAGGLGLGAVMLLLFAGLHDTIAAAPLLGMLFLGVYSFALNGPNVVTSFLGAELSPTRMRTVGQSFSVLGGRIGASTAAFLFPVLFVMTGLQVAIFSLSILAIIAAGLTMVLVPETKQRSLEEISREMEAAGAETEAVAAE
jgi:MFS family permease